LDLLVVGLLDIIVALSLNKSTLLQIALNFRVELGRAQVISA
jgi:hypothetical protein